VCGQPGRGCLIPGLRLNIPLKHLQLLCKPFHSIFSIKLYLTNHLRDLVIRKFVPAMGPEFFENVARKYPKLKQLYDNIASAMFATTPFSLGFPGRVSQSMYYPGSLNPTREEISIISKELERRSIYPENTRIQKSVCAGTTVYDVLIASTESDINISEFALPDLAGVIRLLRGDHADLLNLICDDLMQATKFAANERQRKFLGEYIRSFQTGSLHAYRESQKTWVTDKMPRVENILGFVEPYRDPCGTRAEFEGLVAISDPNETNILIQLVTHSAKFIQKLPWVDGKSTENNGKGPFEKALFEPPDFASIHGQWRIIERQRLRS
jgi:dipeptidyl-peptidase-3